MRMDRMSEAPVVPYRYLTASGVVEKGPCVLHHIIVTPDGSNASYVDIYDGISTSDPKIGRIRIAKTASRPYAFGHHIFLSRGCYLEFESNLESVMISVESAQTYLARALGWEKMRRLT